MCGICGIFFSSSKQPVDPCLLEKMRDSLTHRGPDEAGIWAEGEVGIAMRRLSIIDLSTGSQPIWNEDGMIGVVYNGEIYNYKELREQLERSGHRFGTHSDTEVIVHAYEQYGEACPRYLHGMFAFALWDKKRRLLLLARDRLGIKPLFYAFDEGTLLFGSEIKAILTAGHPRILDLVALDQYMSLFYLPGPLTIFKGIRSLLPGHALVCRGGSITEYEYWDLPYGATPIDDLKDNWYFEQFRDVLRQAVQRHLQSDVPLGAFLSGGLDSSAVVATMSSMLDEPVHTFTIGFDQTSYDERSEAALVAKRFGTKHTADIASPDWEKTVLRLARIFDEPFGDYSSIPCLALSELAHKHVKVVLSGDGGDELLAGYPHYWAHRAARLYRMAPSVVRRKLIRPLVNRLPTSMDRISLDYMAKRFVAGADLPFQRAHYEYKVIFSEAEKESLYTPAFKAAREPEGDGFALFESYFDRVRRLDPLSQMLYVDAKTFLLGDNLTKVDRTSMANSLEVRVPLLDDSLVEFAWRVPSRVKLPGMKTKHLLRQGMKGVLPEEILRGRKKGFTPPMSYWLRGELKELMLESLSPQKVASLGLLDCRYVARLIDEHLKGRKDNNRQLWALVSMMLWWNTYQPSLG